jgi:hypothetical protein
VGICPNTKPGQKIDRSGTTGDPKLSERRLGENRRPSNKFDNEEIVRKK